MRCQYKDGVFHPRIGHWHFSNGCGTGCAQRETRLKFLSAWKRPSKEFNNFFDTLRVHGRIASGSAKPHQETNMTGNAVADCAKARQVDEKTLLKNGG